MGSGSRGLSQGPVIAPLALAMLEIALSGNGLRVILTFQLD
jgi:hypothetical protein